MRSSLPCSFSSMTLLSVFKVRPRRFGRTSLTTSSSSWSKLSRFWLNKCSQSLSALIMNFRRWGFHACVALWKNSEKSWLTRLLIFSRVYLTQPLIFLKQSVSVAYSVTWRRQLPIGYLYRSARDSLESWTTIWQASHKKFVTIAQRCLLFSSADKQIRYSLTPTWTSLSWTNSIYLCITIRTMRLSF